MNEMNCPVEFYVGLIHAEGAVFCHYDSYIKDQDILDSFCAILSFQRKSIPARYTIDCAEWKAWLFESRLWITLIAAYDNSCDYCFNRFYHGGALQNK